MAFTMRSIIYFEAYILEVYDVLVESLKLGSHAIMVSCYFTPPIQQTYYRVREQLKVVGFF